MDATLLANNSQYCFILHTLLHVVQCCWDRSYCAKSETSQTFPHANTRNIVNCCVSFHVALSVSCRVFQRHTQLCSRELGMLRHNRNHTVNLTLLHWIKIFWRIFLAQNALSQSILTQFCTISFSVFFLRFFYSSELSVFDIKIKTECKGDQYIILWKLEITKSWVGATMMKDENAFIPTLCTALVSRDRWSKHAYQNASDPYASDLIAFCKFHSFLVEVQTNAGCIHAMYVQ